MLCSKRKFICSNRSKIFCNIFLISIYLMHVEILSWVLPNSFDRDETPLQGSNCIQTITTYFNWIVCYMIVSIYMYNYMGQFTRKCRVAIIYVYGIVNAKRDLEYIIKNWIKLNPFWIAITSVRLTLLTSHFHHFIPHHFSQS